MSLTATQAYHKFRRGLLPPLKSALLNRFGVEKFEAQEDAAAASLLQEAITYLATFERTIAPLPNQEPAQHQRGSP